MERILVTPLIGMGDTLMTTPALRLLKTRHPDWHITYFTIGKSNYELLRNNPFIDSLIYYPLKSAGIIKGPRYLFKHCFKQCTTSLTFYPANRGAYNLFAVLSGAKIRIGHTYLHNSFSQLNWLKNRTIAENPQLHCVEENVRLLSFFDSAGEPDVIPGMDIFLTDAERASGRAYRTQFDSLPVIGIHAGTSTFKNQWKRRWPKEYFAQLIKRFPNYRFFLFGTQEEYDTNRYIAASANAGQAIMVSNKSIRESAAIIGSCDAFVSNDSGLMHIAAAMQVPTVALLGPTNEAFIRPWNVNHRIAKTGISCSPCFYYSPKPMRCVKNIGFKCLSELSVDTVAGLVQELMPAKD
jgi:heptosyltransferase-2